MVAFAALRVAQITDAHLRGTEGAAAAVVRALDVEKPDYIVMTRDIVESISALPDLEAWAQDFPKTRGIFAIRGNHEVWGRIPPVLLANSCEPGGARLLCHERVTVPVDNATSFTVVGVDDPDAGQTIPPELLQEPLVGPCLWLIHQPGFVPTADGLVRGQANSSPDLILSCHTHGGQVRVPFGPVVTPPGSGHHIAGWYDDYSGLLYVSRGTETSDINARLLCPPELPIFRMEG